VEWLDTELFHDPPDGSRHALDMVAQVPLADRAEPGASASLLLVHVEIEASDRTTQLRSRLPYYYHFLRDKYGLPVLPIVLYLKVGLEGIGVHQCVETVWELEVSRFQYLYVGLHGLDGVEYAKGDNWLGVALSVLMKIPPRPGGMVGGGGLATADGGPLERARAVLAR
jgi:hypothetical protein